jgi:hypothetical protein
MLPLSGFNLPLSADQLVSDEIVGVHRVYAEAIEQALVSLGSSEATTLFVSLT